MDDPNIKTQGQISDLSIRDMVRLASLNLRGASKKIENGYMIQLRHHERNVLTRVSLTRSFNDPDSSNIMVESGAIRDEEINSAISLSDIRHLYVTWETPGQIDFCFASEGRFTLVKVNHESGAFVLNGIDRRATEPMEEELTKDQQDARSQRRTFYHIGSLFDSVKETDSDEEMVDDADNLGDWDTDKGHDGILK